MTTEAFRPLYVILTNEQMDAIDLDAWFAVGGWHERIHDSAPGGAIRLLGLSTVECARMPPGVRWHRFESDGALMHGKISMRQFIRMKSDNLRCGSSRDPMGRFLAAYEDYLDGKISYDDVPEMPDAQVAQRTGRTS